MSLQDTVARFTARLGPNAPQLALGVDTRLLTVAQAILADSESVNQAVANIQPLLAVATLTGAALVRRAGDFGVKPNPGAYASGTGVFKTGPGSAPPAATQTITYPAGTIVGTAGNGVTTPLVTYVTESTVSIASGQTTSPVVSYVAEQVGVAGNVAAGAITIVVTQGASGVFSNATADGGTAATGGEDPDSDGEIRDKIYAVIRPRYGVSAIEAAILAVPGVYDCYVEDSTMGAPAGTITYYWCDQYGVQTNASYPTLATDVQAAVAAVLPPSQVANSAAFTVVNLSAVAVTYSAPAALQTSTLQPQIQVAVAAYIQGNGGTQSGLIHDQIPNMFAMGSAIQTGVNPQSLAPLNVPTVPSLTYFALTSSTPAIGSAAPTTLYRLTGSASSVVTATRQ